MFFLQKRVLIFRTMSYHNTKTDTTTQLYCTLSTYVTPKTISHQNQKTNTTLQLYCTLSTQVCKTKKPISRQNQKLTQNHNWKKKFLQPTCSKCIHSSVCDSVRLSGPREGYGVEECFTERLVVCLSVCIEGIL